MPPSNSDVIRYEDLQSYGKWHCAVYVHVPNILKVEDGMHWVPQKLRYHRQIQEVSWNSKAKTASSYETSVTFTYQHTWRQMPTFLNLQNIYYVFDQCVPLRW